MRLLAAALATVCFYTSVALAQSPASDHAINAKMVLSSEKLAAGARFKIAVVIDLQSPWHINANPASIEGLIPTTLTIQPPDAVQIDRIIYPRGKTLKVAWADEPVALYEGRAILFADARVLENATPGQTVLDAKLRFQACNDSVCLAPVTMPMSVEADIVDATTPVSPAHPEIFSAIEEPVSSPTEPTNRESIEQRIEQRGLMVTLGFLFLGGLALNLTPCVFPMIAITVSYFGGQGERSLARSFSNALIYCLGMVLTYSTFGLVAALTGSLFGSLLQSRLVLVAIAGLMVALALSMFGLYELRPPSFLVQHATGLSNRAGFIGVMLLGAVVGIIAAPCIAPVQVALLAYVGQRGDPWLGWWLFFSLSLGLGSPYIVLGTFPGLLARLPKSGTWMVWVKRVFGVLLLIVAAWFLQPLWRSRVPAKSPINWQPFSTALVENPGRPVLIDFTADWCAPCHEMDRFTYTQPRIVELSQQFLMVRADVTRADSEDVKRLREQFRVLGVPTTVFLDATGHEYVALRQVGFVPREKFALFMEQALAMPAASDAETAPASSEIPPQLKRQF
jgi:thiol:disulfide interchange protein DsbD